MSETGPEEGIETPEGMEDDGEEIPEEMPEVEHGEEPSQGV